MSNAEQTRIPATSQTVQNNMFEYMFYLGRASGGTVHDGGSVKWVYTGRPVFNRLFGISSDLTRKNEALREALGTFKATRTPVTWLVNATENNLQPGKCGFSSQGSWTGMAYDLSQLPTDLKIPADYAIAPVSDSKTLGDWIETACAGFQFTGDIKRAYQKFFMEVGVTTGYDAGRFRRWQPYLLTIEGKPVATGAMYNGTNAAGIYWTATMPGTRRHGIATALTRYMLREAARNGYSQMVLQATTMGEPVYRKLGFEQQSAIGIHTWRPRFSMLRLPSFSFVRQPAQAK
jgi:GNAT superfamily N-acetyltransferase